MVSRYRWYVSRFLFFFVLRCAEMAVWRQMDPNGTRRLAANFARYVYESRGRRRGWTHSPEIVPIHPKWGTGGVAR